MPHFHELHQRLTDLLLDRIRSGQLTERGLSRMTGVSQPHIHNVLKGKRFFSTDAADAILHELKLDVLDFLSPIELAGRLWRCGLNSGSVVYSVMVKRSPNEAATPEGRLKRLARNI